MTTIVINEDLRVEHESSRWSIVFYKQHRVDMYRYRWADGSWYDYIKTYLQPRIDDETRDHL